MKKVVLVGMIFVLLASSVDARNRRARRRQGRRASNVQTSPFQHTNSVTQLVPGASSAVQSADVAAAATPSRVTALKPVVEGPTTAVADPLPVVDESITEENSVVAAPLRAAAPVNAALAELNSIRARRGLRAFIEDPSLTAVALHKASIQARRGVMYHPGGSMGGARYEGVGMGPWFTTCYQYATHATYAGAASVTGANGQRFHCLLLR